MINIILQGKGGVGKSLISSLLAQYLLTKSKNPVFIDTDPVNATFAGYKTLGVPVTHINILQDGNVNPREFDKLMELIISTPDADFVIDNGSTSFLPISSYLYDNNAIEILKEMGHSITLHTVVTGGQALLDTLSGVKTLASQFDYTQEGTNLVVWANEYFGDIESKGKKLEEMSAYKTHKDKMSGLIVIDRQNELSRQDVKEMLESKLTFDDVKKAESFSFMAKNRINIFKGQIFESIDAVYKTLSVSKGK